jgi:hypothetical protein
MLSAEALLQVWEHGQRCREADRSLQLLARALPGRDRDALAAVDLARRDWYLLQLRRQWFGPALAGYADCPACGERMEITFDAEAVAGECPAESPAFVSRNGRRFRLPTVGDLVAVAGIDDVDAAAHQLFERCSLDGPPHDDLPAIFDEVDEGLSSLADDRSIFLNLSCTRCGAPSRHALDPAAYLWSEISTAATMLLEEVHLLARAYGWSERDILAMGPVRRHAYLNRLEP